MSRRSPSDRARRFPSDRARKGATLDQVSIKSRASRWHAGGSSAHPGHHRRLLGGPDESVGPLADCPVRTGVHHRSALRAWFHVEHLGERLDLVPVAGEYESLEACGTEETIMRGRRRGRNRPSPQDPLDPGAESGTSTAGTGSVTLIENPPAAATPPAADPSMGQPSTSAEPSGFGVGPAESEDRADHL
jgi:hypothetical protein